MRLKVLHSTQMEIQEVGYEILNMKRIINMGMIFLCALALTGCSKQNNNSKYVQEIVNSSGDVFEYENLNVKGYDGNL